MYIIAETFSDISIHMHHVQYKQKWVTAKIESGSLLLDGHNITANE